MLINNVNSSANLYSANAVAATRRSSAATASRGVEKRDEIMLSNTAQSFNDMLKKLRGESEVRQEKVDEFSAKIASGNYDVKAENIAASILASRF